VAVVGVHVHHFPDVPDLERPIVAHGIELVILLVELCPSDGVPVALERLDLLLVVDVPNPDHLVLSTRYQELAVLTDGEGADLVPVPLHPPAELLASKEALLLRV